jgi:hypothetical protein
LAKPTDHFRASDVTLWGLVALCCWGGAVMLANISAVLPMSFLSGLHASRLEGSTIAQLRMQVTELADETRRMRSENNLLVSRFDRAEQASKETVRRIGAIEISLPDAFEARAATTGPGIDSMPTASIGGGRSVTFDADGGSVSVVQKPLFPARSVTAEVNEAALADPSAFGLALGFPLPADEAEARWQEYAAKVGTLLIGLVPLLQPAEDAEGVRIIAGPIADRTQAEQLCSRMDQVGIPCEASSFTGDALPLLN